MKRNWQKVIRLQKKGLTIQNISLSVDLSTSQIHRILKKFNLKVKPPNSIYRNNKISEIKLLIKDRKEDKEISKITGICKSTVGRIRKEILGYNSWRDTIKFTERQKSILVGSIMGDSYISPSNPNSQLVFAHCVAQKEYFLWKFKELSNLFTKYVVSNKYRKETMLTEIRTYPIMMKSLNYYREIFYINGIKSLTETNVKFLDELGLAVLFMDDGGKADTTYQICTQSFSREGCEFLQRHLFEIWGIHTTLNKKNVLRIKMCSRDLFTSIIKSNIVPTMQYKLHQ